MKKTAVALLATLAAGLAGLPAPASAGPRPAAAHTPAMEEEKTVTWEVLPKQNEGEPFRSNFSWLMKAGDEREDVVRVRNYSNTDMKLNLYGSDAFNSATGALDLLATGEKPREVGDWIKIPMNALNVKGGEFVDIPFRVKVPKDAESGDHVGGIVTSYLGEEKDEPDGSRVTLDRRLGTRVQIRVEGPLRPSLTISKLKTRFKGPTNPVGAGTLHATYTVTNDGNVRMAATQSIKVKAPVGFPSRSRTLAELPELLPGNSLTLSAEVTGVLPTVRSSTTIRLTPKPTREGDEFGADVIQPVASTAVWSWPWALLLLIVLLGGGFEGRRRLRRREQADEDRRIEDKITAKLGGAVNREATP